MDEPESRQTVRTGPLTIFLVALQFLTISPAFLKRPFTPTEMGRAAGLFPLVGALLGALLIGLDLVLARFFPHLVRSALVLAFWVLLTGALHLDGFLDACDGLLGGFTPECRLEIMRDERVGAFALVGGFLLLLVKFTALASLPTGSAALLLAPALGRWGMTVSISAFPYARSQGLGRAMKDHTRKPQVILATAIALAAAAAAAGFLREVQPLIAPILALLVVGSVARFALDRIPGLTGDLYGTINELVEAAVLLLFVAGRQV